MMAKAIWDKIPLNLCLNQLLIRYLIGKNEQYDLEDLKCFDTMHFNSLKYINENSIDENKLIEQYFVYDKSDGTTHDLAQDGGKIKVTDDNKMEYTVVKIEYMTKEIVSV